MAKKTTATTTTTTTATESSFPVKDVIIYGSLVLGAIWLFRKAAAGVKAGIRGVLPAFKYENMPIPTLEEAHKHKIAALKDAIEYQRKMMEVGDYKAAWDSLLGEVSAMRHVPFAFWAESVKSWLLAGWLTSAGSFEAPTTCKVRAAIDPSSDCANAAKYLRKQVLLSLQSAIALTEVISQQKYPPAEELFKDMIAKAGAVA